MSERDLLLISHLYLLIQGNEPRGFLHVSYCVPCYLCLLGVAQVGGPSSGVKESFHVPDQTSSSVIAFAEGLRLVVAQRCWRGFDWVIVLKRQSLSNCSSPLLTLVVRLSKELSVSHTNFSIDIFPLKRSLFRIAKFWRKQIFSNASTFLWELDISKCVINHARNVYLFVTISSSLFYAVEYYAINGDRFF